MGGGAHVGQTAHAWGGGGAGYLYIYSYILGGLNCPGGGGGGFCEMKAIHGVKKMVNNYPLIAHSAQRMKFLTEIMPHIVQLDHFAFN